MTKYETNPSLADVIVQSRKLEGKQQIVPPADWPGLFGCDYRGFRAIGCVYRCGVVFIVPDELEHSPGPVAFQNMKAVDESPDVKNITWEWGVVRYPENTLPSELKVM